MLRFRTAWHDCTLGLNRVPTGCHAVGASADSRPDVSRGATLRPGKFDSTELTWYGIRLTRLGLTMPDNFISPESFTEAFCRVFQANAVAFKTAWDHSQAPPRGINSDKGYTRFFEQVVYPCLARELCLDVRCKGTGGEYKRYDAVFWPSTDSLSADSIRVVLEHENKHPSFMNEVQKLSPSNIPLRVLILYSSRRIRVGRLTEIARAIATAPLSDKSRFLLIWGESKATVLTWEFHWHNGVEFSQISTFTP